MTRTARDCMTSFRTLYEYCQTLEPKIKRKQILDKVLEITGVETVKPVVTTLDTTKVRGFFISVNNKEHPLVRQLGCNVIVIARGLNKCWDRFVFVKELMHLFDSEEEMTASDLLFEQLLTEFEISQPGEFSRQTVSDVRAFWMALACFCPENNRLEFIEQLNKGHIDHYGIALRLRIPQLYVPHLLRPNFNGIVTSLL